MLAWGKKICPYPHPSLQKILTITAGTEDVSPQLMNVYYRQFPHIEVQKNAKF